MNVIISLKSLLEKKREKFKNLTVYFHIKRIAHKNPLKEYVPLAEWPTSLLFPFLQQQLGSRCVVTKY